jgi:hypothetical protein
MLPPPTRTPKPPQPTPRARSREAKQWQVPTHRRVVLQKQPWQPAHTSTGCVEKSSSDQKEQQIKASETASSEHETTFCALPALLLPYDQHHFDSFAVNLHLSQQATFAVHQ